MTIEENHLTDEELIAEAEMSPCVGVCKSDDSTGWCFGCGRTDTEIEQWQTLDGDTRSRVEAELPGRVEELIARRRAERGGGSSRRSRRRS